MVLQPPRVPRHGGFGGASVEREANVRRRSGAAASQRFVAVIGGCVVTGHGTARLIAVMVASAANTTAAARAALLPPQLPFPGRCRCNQNLGEANVRTLALFTGAIATGAACQWPSLGKARGGMTRTPGLLHRRKWATCGGLLR